MERKRAITLANIGLLIALIIINHFSWLGIDFKYYFPSLFLFIVACYNIPKSSNKLINNLINGYFLGFAIDTFLRKLFGYDESHIGEILAIGLPLLGCFWRNYRKETNTALKVTGIATLAKWLIALLDKLFL